MFATRLPLALAALALGLAAPTASADPSDLDRSFAAGGIAAKEFPGGSRFEAIAEQPDGRIVAAGAVSPSTYASEDLLVTRFHKTGRLDGSFGNGGRVRTPVGNDDDEARAIAVLPSGKILVTGRSEQGDDASIVVARYLADGDPDPGFGAGGVATFDLSETSYADEAGEGIVVGAGGHVVIAGETNVGGQPHAFTLRLDDDGGLDTTYCGTGKCIVDEPGLTVSGVTAGPAGSVVLAGSYSVLGAVLRVDAFGARDASFAGYGLATYSLGTGAGRLHDVTLGPDGSVVATGWANDDPGGHGTAILKLTPAGEADTGFGGGDGRVRVAVGPPDTLEWGEAVTVAPDGRIVVAGSYNGDSAGLVLLRLGGDGTLDSSFSGDGIQTLTGGDPAAAAVILAGDRVLAAGSRLGMSFDASVFAFADRTRATGPAPVVAGPAEPLPVPAPTTSPRAAVDPRLDRTAPRLSRVALSTRRLRTRASLGFTVSEAARVTVVLERRSGARRMKARTLVRRVKAGRASIRLVARGLRRGRHVVRVVAVDAAGNRSSERRLRLRVSR